MNRKYIDEVRSYIFNLAREQSLSTGHVLVLRPPQILSLNPAQRDCLTLALDELVNEGYFTKNDNGKYVLTNKGLEHIY